MSIPSVENHVYLLVYFSSGIKTFCKLVFKEQEEAIAYAVANHLDSWHLVQLGVFE